MTTTINGNSLKNAIIHGINKLNENKDEINALNVFPVPDGDTGTNMTMTAHSAASKIENLETEDIYAVAKEASGGALRGARGNSGVILSQLFRGFAKGLEGKTEVDTKGLSIAFVKAMEAAYKAVMKPKEGTILTIARALAESSIEISKKETDIKAMLNQMISAGHKMLEKTQFMLQELKDAGVVDAGGRGLLYVLEGAVEASGTATLVSIGESKSTTVTYAGSNAANIKFAYCTEMFIDLSTKKTHTFEQIEGDMLRFLDSQGDSIVLVGDEDIIKIHVHTNNPGAVMERSLTYGDLSNIKIENMKLQHQEIVSFAKDIHTAPTMIGQEEVKPIVKKEIELKPIGILAVSSGSGFADLFNQLYVDHVIEGGQTMNPSTESFLQAIEQIHAKDIIILPNNSNIILAAQQAAKMLEGTEKTLHVLPTKTVPQGISAMYNFEADNGLAANLTAMENAAKATKTGQITYAVKDTTYKSLNIKKDQILCILDDKIIDAKDSVEDGAKAFVQRVIKEEPEFINIYYGEDTTENDAKELKKYIESINKSIEVEVYNGGQSHYYYIISVE